MLLCVKQHVALHVVLLRSQSTGRSSSGISGTCSFFGTDDVPLYYVASAAGGRPRRAHAARASGGLEWGRTPSLVGLFASSSTARRCQLRRVDMNTMYLRACFCGVRVCVGRLDRSEDRYLLLGHWQLYFRGNAEVESDRESGRWEVDTS